MKGPSTAFGGPPPLQIQGRMFGEAAAQLSGPVMALLGWRPDEFWNATPEELAAALNLTSEATEPPNPTTIEELKRRFPD